MTHRLYATFVLVAWLASMTWLVASKIWPTMHGGQPPNYAASLTPSAEASSPAVWRIAWEDRRIGTAASQLRPRGRGSAMRYVVQFDQLPLDAILSETLGPLGALFKGSLGEGPLDLRMQLATEVRFDEQQQFAGFQSLIDVADVPGFLRLDGRIHERRKLVVTSRMAGATSNLAGPTMKHEFDLPGNAVINDAFAPRPELTNLHVGQRWTIPIYRPFPPGSPPQIVEAVAERHELMLWDAGDVETILVVYRNDAGSGLHATREPIAREWIGPDGVVIQHEVRMGNSTVRFERLPNSEKEPIVALLRNDRDSRLWRGSP